MVNKLSYVIAIVFVVITSSIVAFLYFTAPDSFSEIESITENLGPYVFRFVYGGHYVKDNETYVYALESSDPDAQTDVLVLCGNYSSNFTQLTEDVEIEIALLRDDLGKLYLAEIKE